MSHPIPPVEVIDEFVECSRYGEMEEMQRMMLEYPLLSSAVSATFNNNTALHYASANNLIPILDLLLPHYPPAMVNLPNHDGNTALHMASLMGHAEAVDRLLMHGADANLKNESGRSPATLAEQ